MKQLSKYISFLILSYFTLLPSAIGTPIAGQGTWESTLQGRDLNGDGTVDAWYDSTLDITWLEDANLPLTNDFFGVAGIDSYGKMNWNTAIAYVGKMNSHTYLGQTGWRLPRHTDFSSDGCSGGVTTSGGDCSYNPDPSSGELAHMAQVTLANTSWIDPVTGDSVCGSWCLTSGNMGPFMNIHPFHAYWYGQGDITNLSQAWGAVHVFAQRPLPKSSKYQVWPVLDGDVGVPAIESLVLETESLPVGFEGDFYIGELSATGGVLPYEWHLSAGTLPQGLELDKATGEITGIPDQMTTSQVQFIVVDAQQNTSEVNLTIVIHSKVGC